LVYLPSGINKFGKKIAVSAQFILRVTDGKMISIGMR